MPPTSTAPGRGTLPTPGALEPLMGYTIGVTAERRREELGAALRALGATVVYGPAISIVPPAGDPDLRATTDRALDGPIDHLVVTTAAGCQAWADATSSWGWAPRLIAATGATATWVRTAEAAAIVRRAGLAQPWVAPTGTTSEILDRLLALPTVSGKRIVIQLHGDPPAPIAPSMAGGAPYADVMHTLRARGADVIELPVFRWVLPEDVEPLHDLLVGIVGGAVDAVTFTSPHAASSLLGTADDRGIGREVRTALASRVLAACIGPVTASALLAAGIQVVTPERYQLAELVDVLAAEVPLRCGRRFTAAGHVFDVRGHALVLDGQVHELPSTGTALLRALAHQPGRVVSRERLLALLPGDRVSGHAVDVAMGRLRTALGDPAVIATVVKRGYRLAVD